MSAAEELARPFPRDVLEDTQRGGRSFTYIPASEVIVRLNQVLGPENWSSEADAHRDGEWIIAKVILTVRMDGQITHATQYGGQEIKRYTSGKRAGEVMDLSSDYKGAVSDALKKAAQQLGVGLYLARTEQAKRLIPQSRRAESHEGGGDQPREGESSGRGAPSTPVRASA